MTDPGSIQPALFQPAAVSVSIPSATADAVREALEQWTADGWLAGPAFAGLRQSLLDAAAAVDAQRAAVLVPHSCAGCGSLIPGAWRGSAFQLAKASDLLTARLAELAPEQRAELPADPYSLATDSFDDELSDWLATAAESDSGAQ